MVYYIYKNLSGRSGVYSYQYGEHSIFVRFSNNHQQTYVYTDEKPGLSIIQQMQTLAVAGRGLNTYINKYVKKNYYRIVEEAW